MPTPFFKRSTSPLDCEPLVPASEDILYAGSDDETSEEHRKKRRRIERNAQQYLRGQPLFILSAGLRGPLNEWVNPWARKRPEKAKKKPDRQNEGFSRFSLPEEASETLSRLPNNFNDGDERDLDRAVKPPHQPSTNWLKAENAFFRSPHEEGPRSPTPTPVAKSRDRGLLAMTRPADPLLKNSPPPQASLIESNQSSSKPIHDNAFTPINKRVSPQDTETHDGDPPPAPADFPEHKHEAEAAQVIRQDHYKSLFQEAEEKAAIDRQLKSSRPSPPSAAGVVKVPPDTDGPHIQPLDSESLLEDSRVEQATTKDTGIFEGSLQALPPSTNLPEFEYRYATKQTLNHYKNRPSFAETLEIEKVKALDMEMAKAKAVAQEKMIRRLSFTDSGKIKDKSQYRRRQRDDSGSPSHRSRTSSFKPIKSNERSTLSTKDRSEVLSASTPVATSGGPSHDVNDLPEAQIVPPDPIMSGLVPSGPSTNMLETEKQSIKFPSMDEGDSYAHLSTQAAVIKAQRSFQNSVVSPLKISPQHRRRPASSELGPATSKKTKSPSMPTPTFQDPSEHAKSLTPENEEVVEGEPMSTQAMVDAMSPFAITTIKKKNRTSLALSPNSPIPTPFAPHNLSMSTTPTHTPPPSPHRNLPPGPLSRTHSKPSSSGLKSFSLVPDGSLTERYQHDGQQQQPPTNYLDTSSWDLDAAIEDAGQFLGHWDVELEARKEGKLGSSDARNVTHESKRDEGTRSGLVERVGGSG